MVIASIFIVGLLIAVLLIVIGLRGYRVGDHPYCRNCGFDLFGLPGDSEKCPECGSEIGRGVHIGQRFRRRWALVTGLVVFLVFGCAATLFILKTDLDPYKPIWWLKQEALVPAKQGKAVREMNRRLNANKLSQSDIDNIADFALVQQAAVNKAWMIGLGSFIETARSQKHIDDARWKKYAEQAIQTPTFRVRAYVRQGDPLPMGWTVNSPRSAWPSSLTISIQNHPYAQLGQDQHGFDDDNPRRLNESYTGITYSDMLNHAKADAAQPGIYNAGIDVTFKVFDGKQQLAKKDFSLKGTWEMVSSSKPTVHEVHDDSLGPKILSALGYKSLQQSLNSDYFFNVSFNPLPVGVAFRAEAKSGERTWKFESSRISGTQGGMGNGFAYGSLDGLSADKVDIVLKSDVTEAVKTLYVDEMWVGEIVIKDVPVTRLKPSTRRSK